MDALDDGRRRANLTPGDMRGCYQLVQAPAPASDATRVGTYIRGMLNWTGWLTLTTLGFVASCSTDGATSVTDTTAGGSDTGATSSDTGATSSVGATEPTSAASTTDQPPACGNFDDPNENGFYLYSAVYSDEPSSYDGSCYTASGPETYVPIVFPDGGPFSFLVTAAAFTPRMAILGDLAGCDSEIECVAQVSDVTAIYRTFTPGEQIRVVVDTADLSQSGDFELEVHQGTFISCNDYSDEFDDPPPTGRYDDLANPYFWQDTSHGSCGGMNHRDYRYTWTPPGAGQYRLTLTPEGFDAVLYAAPDVYDPDPDSYSCVEELACADEAGLDGPETITVTLADAQPIRIFIDGRPGVGAPGWFTLDIEQL